MYNSFLKSILILIPINFIFHTSAKAQASENFVNNKCYQLLSNKASTEAALFETKTMESDSLAIQKLIEKNRSTAERNTSIQLNRLLLELLSQQTLNQSEFNFFKGPKSDLNQHIQNLLNMGADPNSLYIPTPLLYIQWSQTPDPKNSNSVINTQVFNSTTESEIAYANQFIKNWPYQPKLKADRNIFYRPDAQLRSILTFNYSESDQHISRLTASVASDLASGFSIAEAAADQAYFDSELLLIHAGALVYPKLVQKNFLSFESLWKKMSWNIQTHPRYYPEEYFEALLKETQILSFSKLMHDILENDVQDDPKHKLQNKDLENEKLYQEFQVGLNRLFALRLSSRLPQFAKDQFAKQLSQLTISYFSKISKKKDFKLLQDFTFSIYPYYEAAIDLESTDLLNALSALRIRLRPENIKKLILKIQNQPEINAEKKLKMTQILQGLI